MNGADATAWRMKAKCAGRGALFFDDACEQRAKRICAARPVMVECLEHALDQPEPYGVWGGKTAKERQQLALLRTARKGGNA